MFLLTKSVSILAPPKINISPRDDEHEYLLTLLTMIVITKSQRNWNMHFCPYRHNSFKFSHPKLGKNSSQNRKHFIIILSPSGAISKALIDSNVTTKYIFSFKFNQFLTTKDTEIWMIGLPLPITFNRI